ncbi:MAG: hypothetical protein M1825_002305 [Sarcosagium campestre]|nr:MAG: hypothetical protein M1825_002305 [Sarcosagium campestre]
MPLPSLFSDPGRARKTGERTSRSAGNSTKTSTKTHHSTRPRSLSKKTTKPTSSTPPKSPPPPGQSPDTLDSASAENIPPPPGLPAEVQEDPKPEELPPLPESVAPSPASSFSHLPEASSLSSSAILPARSPNSLEVQTNPPAPTVEDEVSEVGIEHYLVEQPSPEPIEEFFDLGEDTRSKSGRASPDLQRDPSPSPSRISISSVHSERNASDDTPRGPVYTSQGESPSYFQHSSSAPEPLPAHYHSSYHPVERFFPPQHPAPQYYPMPHPQSRFVPSLHPGPLVSVQGQGFPPHFSPPPPPPPLATFAPPSHRPFPMAALQGGQLERQSSGGSRGSLAGESAVQLSPMTGFLRSVGSSEGSGGGAASIGDEGIELTQRIQSTMANMANISAALPDLHQLLTRYHDTHGQLGHREELLRRAEVQQAEALRQKEQHIHSLAKQIDGQAAKHSAESSKLRLEIGNLEEKHKELVDSLHATERAKLELQEKKASLEIEKVDLERKAVKDHEVLREDLERWKNTMMENFSRRKQMQEEDFERRLQGLEISHGREKEEMNERFIKECEILRAGFTQQKAELEGRLLARHEEERQTWSMQRDELERRLDQHRIEWNKRLEDQKCALQEEHIKDQERLQTEIQRCNEERIASEAARELIQAGWSKDRSDYERMTADLRADIDRLGKEKDKLQRMVETFGDVTDIKGKGDAY